MPRLLAAPLLLALLVPAAAPAQSAPAAPADTAALPAGARVRVHLDVPTIPDPERVTSVADMRDVAELARELSRPVGPPVVGSVRGWRADTLLLELGSGGATAAVPAPRVLRLEVSRGVPDPAEGAVRGALGGLVGGLLAGLSAHGIATLAGDAPGLLDMMQMGALLGAAGGALRGGLAPRERWRDVPLSTLRPPASPPPAVPAPPRDEEEEEEDGVEEVEMVLPSTRR